jgi:hypothetical protein
MDTAGFAHLFRSAILPQSGLTPAERSNFLFPQQQQQHGARLLRQQRRNILP